MIVGDSVLGSSHNRYSITLGSYGQWAGNLAGWTSNGLSQAYSTAHLFYSNWGSAPEIDMNTVVNPQAFTGANATLNTTSFGYNGNAGFITVQINPSNSSEQIGQRVLVTLTGTFTVNSGGSNAPVGYTSGQILYVPPNGPESSLIKYGNYYTGGSVQNTAQFYATIGGSFQLAMVEYASASQYHNASSDLHLTIRVQ
jgi:hypothetical protein